MRLWAARDAGQMRWVILDLGELSCLIDVIKLYPGPSGEDAEWYRLTSRCRITYPVRSGMDRPTSGPNSSCFPDEAGRCSFGAQFVPMRSIMANQYLSSTHADELAGTFDCDAVNALVTAGAFVALADGRVQTVERDEVVHYIHRRRFAPTREHVTYLVDERARQLQEADFANVVLEALRLVSSMSLTSEYDSYCRAGGCGGSAHAS
jgi:hypothetical protein